jgi:hypothetical protein
MSKNTEITKIYNNKEIEDFSSRILKTDFSSFLKKSFKTINPNINYLHNFHLDLICKALEACE